MRIKPAMEYQEQIGLSLIVGLVILGAVFISRIYWFAEGNEFLTSNFITFIGAIIIFTVIPALIVIVSAISEIVFNIRNRSAGEVNTKET